MQLPVILNVNPRSLFNKQENFKTYVKERQVEIVCVSESWETEENRIEKIFNDVYAVISNPYVRRGLEFVLAKKIGLETNAKVK